MKNQVYVVIGWEYEQGEYYKEIYGIFSEKKLADECIGYIMEEIENLTYCEIEEVELDAFGYR